MPGKLIERFVLCNNKGKVFAEASLFVLSELDEYIKRGINRTYVELSDVWVAKEHRGFGHANSVLRIATQYAADRGWCIFIRAIPYDSGNLEQCALINWYERNGFKRRKDAREMIWRPK